MFVPQVGAESVLDRLSLGLSAVSVWLYSPITLLVGWGVGSFQHGSEAVWAAAYPYSGFGWTNVLAEQGLLGLVAYSAFFGTLAAKWWRLQRASAVIPRRLAPSFRLMIIMFVLSGFTGGFGFERSVVLWSLLSSLNLVARSALQESTGMRSVEAEC
jgi:O-antigen ligase